MKKLKHSKKWFTWVAVIAVVAVVIGVGVYVRGRFWPITFEGTVSKQVGGLGGDKGCGIDDDCMIVVNGKTVLVLCGWGVGNNCPLESHKMPDVPPVGAKVRITALKDRGDGNYNLRCNKCGVAILK